MTLSRFTWGILLAAICFTGTFRNATAKADESICPYIAGQGQVCPLPQDHCDEYLYEYELADAPAAPAEESQEAAEDLIEDCPFRSIHDAIYDAEVYGFQTAADESAEKCLERITVVHTQGCQSVEVEAADDAVTPPAPEAEPVVETEEYSYEDEADFYDDFDDYDYESYEYDYYYEDKVADESANADEAGTSEADEGQVVADDDQWDEFGAYDEYDYDEYYYENYESEAVETQASDVVEGDQAEASATKVVESPETRTPPAIDDESVEEAPMPYDEYGYDEYSVEEAEPAADDDYAENGKSVKATEEASTVDLWGEGENDEAAQDATADAELDEYDKYWSEEPATAEPAATDTANEKSDLHAIEQALRTTGILPVAEIVLGRISLDELASQLPEAAEAEAAEAEAEVAEGSDVVESTPPKDAGDWEDWDCYYEFEQQEEVQEAAKTDASGSLGFLQRQALKMLATSMDRAGRTLQTVSADLMRMSGSEVADATSSTNQLK